MTNFFSSNILFKIFVLQILFSLMITPSFAQSSKFTIGGVIKDASTNELLVGVPINIVGSQARGVASNENGFYSITLLKGEYTLSISYIGYETQTLKIALDQSITRDILLVPSSVELDEVVVSSQRSDQNVSGVQTGVEKLTIQQISKLPVLMGERDVIKSLQLLPGVKPAGEASSGYFVRGGTTDQNAMLLDNAPVYNASHLLGFFSTFNPDAVKDVTLYKGAMPAQYGERLASVLDVQMKEGDNQSFHVNGGIGLISSKLSLEGPIQKGKSSFILSGRRTYADLIARMSGIGEAKDATLYFYDVNLKMNYILSNKDRLFVSGYLGQDKLGLNNLINTGWGNKVASIRWNRMVNNKLYSNTTLIYNEYFYDIDLGLNLGLKIKSNINDYSLKQDFQYYFSPMSMWRFGYHTTYHNVSPGKATFEESKGQSRSNQTRYSWANAVYANNTLRLSDDLEVSYGMRINTFSVLGKGDFFVVNDHEIVDTLSYKSGEIVKTYLNLEPRISSTYRINQSTSLKAAYGRNTQNMHLISNSAMTMPFDRWASSSNIIKPQIADQITFGYFRNFSYNMFEFSAEVYYKNMQNQIDFRDNAEMYREDAIEHELLFGKGRAYGIEFLLKKAHGRFTGWIAYTLAKSERKIDGINNNKWYDATQDRTHDISIVAVYELNKKWTLSGAWVYYTGNAVTYPSGKYHIDGQDIPYYTERNGYRAPDYHRLDLGANCVLKDTKKFYSELSFSLYNAYGRENPYMLDFRTNDNDPSKMTVYQYSLFRFVPSISWNFKF